MTPDRSPKPEDVKLADNSNVIVLFQQPSEDGVLTPEASREARRELRALARENPDILLSCKELDPEKAREILSPYIEALRKQTD